MSNHEEFESKIKELRNRFNLALPLKLRSIELGWIRLCTINWSQPLLDNLTVITNQLAASSKTFGFGGLSIEAKELASLFVALQKKALPPESDEKARVDKKIRQLNLAAGIKSFDAQDLSLPDNSPQQGQKGLIYLVDSDSSYCYPLELTLQKHGFSTQSFSTLSTFYQALEHNVPDVVCLDIVFPEGKQAGISAVEAIRRLTTKKVHVLFISSRSDMVARLKALRVGGKAYLTKPVDEDAVKDIIVDILNDNPPGQILLIDGDKAFAKHTSGVLKRAGYRIKWIADPVETLATLEQFPADLIVTDYHMPHCNGVELAELLRQDQRYMDIPILFFSLEKDKNVQQKAHSISGNAFLTKPADDKSVLAVVNSIIVKSHQVKSRLKLVRSYQAASSLVSRSFLYTELATAIANAAESEICRHVLYIAVDRTDFLKRRFGLKIFTSLEEQIRDFLAKKMATQLLVQMKEDLYVVMLSPLSAAQALDFAELICRSCAERKFTVAGSSVTVTLSIGLTVINHQVNSLERCLSYSEEGCVIASQKGGNTVICWPELTEGASGAQSILEPRILQAIEKQAYKLVYQPVVNLDETEKLYECRVRLVDSDKKELLPNQFMPFIQAHRLQFDLDRWVIQNALATLMSLTGLEREEINLIVKVMPESYNFGQIINFIANLVRNSKLKGQYRLFLQVDEEWAVVHRNGLKREVERLNSVGIGFILDHVGQSEYGISLISDIVPTMIKLDMTLVAEFYDNETSRKRLTDILALASQIQIRVIAGTVEDAKIFASLWGMGVRYFQGNFIQQPGHALDFDFQSFNYE